VFNGESPVEGSLPGLALGDELLLRLERGAVVTGLSLAVLVLVGRLLIEGRLPTRISRESAEWSDIAVPASDARIAAIHAGAARLRELSAAERAASNQGWFGSLRSWFAGR